MDAVEFIKERQRLCQTYVDCFKCPAYNNNIEGCNFNAASGYEAIEQIRLLEEWSAAHPRKTRQSVFIKQYPQVAIYNGVIGIRPCQIEEGYTSLYCLGDSSRCVQCRKEYWLQEGAI
nr:MAG TPA: hypothetical protein [Caudoviricetes sp.]